MSYPTSSTGRLWSTTQLAWGSIGSLVAGVAFLYAAGFHCSGQWQTGARSPSSSPWRPACSSSSCSPTRGVIYTELKGTTSSYQRRQLIQKNQWASDREVADLCDQRIQAFDARVFEPPQELPGEAAASRQPA